MRKKYDVQNTGNQVPGWYADGNYSKVTSVVFSPQFAGVKPTSTYAWFTMSRLKSITGLEYLNTSQVTNMGRMFEQCWLLTEIDLSHFNTANVKSMASMFSGCHSLKTIDLSTFNTAKVENMAGMFMECTGLTYLDLSSFTTANVTDTRKMFMACDNLVTICANDWTLSGVSLDVNDVYMFSGCRKLRGERNTSYSETRVNKYYARIDGGAYSAGYFSRKSSMKTYNLWVGGVQVTDMNRNDVLQDGKVSYDAATSTLTLKNGTKIVGQGSLSDKTTGYANGIYSEVDGLTIDVELGTATVETQTTNSLYCGLYLNGNTTITGDGLLLVRGAQGVLLYSNNATLLTLKNNARLSVNATNMGLRGYAKLRIPDMAISTLSIKDNAEIYVWSDGECIGNWKNIEMPNGAYLMWSGSNNNPQIHHYDTEKLSLNDSAGNMVKGTGVNIKYKAYDAADVNHDRIVDSADIVGVIKAMK